jgi:hypothetical protein
MTTRTAQGAIAWAVSLNTFPYLAVPAHWVFGRRNFEFTVLAYHEGFARELEQMFLADFERSHELQKDLLKEKPLYFRAAVRAARLMAPLQ